MKSRVTCCQLIQKYYLNTFDTMPSEYDIVAFLRLADKSLYQYGGPILMGLGTVSCILSLLVFTKKHLRKNPCSLYLIAYHISSFLLIYTSILSTTLSYGYSINPSLYNLVFCRFSLYTMVLFDVLSPSYLILAAVDRVLVTSPNVRTRQRRTSHLACICIISVTLFWLICHSHVLIFSNFIQVAPGFGYCYFLPGIHSALVAYYTLVIKTMLIPLLMMMTGLRTVRNVRRVTRILPAPIIITRGTKANDRIRCIHSKDHQLIKILLVDTSVYIIFNIMSAVVQLYQEFTSNQSRTYVQSQIQTILLTIAVFSTYIPFCVDCYTSLLVSKTFRHGVKKILMCK